VDAETARALDAVEEIVSVYRSYAAEVLSAATEEAGRAVVVGQ
jgi:hypothetical protein